MPHCPSAGIKSIVIHPLLLHHQERHPAPRILNRIRTTARRQSQNSTANTSYPTNGVITLTDKPGLGIDIDEAVLAKQSA